MPTHRSLPALRPTTCLAVITLFATLLTGLRADENYFGYTYGSETLPKGRWEIYQWATSRTGKADGSYRALDLQTEIEHGFTDRLQGSLYLNAIKHDISRVTDFSDRNQVRFNGLQAALKYSFKSPYKDGYGLALYLEPGYKRYSAKSGDRVDIFFIEPKLILQKNFLEDSLVWAVNFSGEFEREHNLDEREWESELELQLSTGLSYRFAPNWFAGIEALATSAFERMHLDALGEYGLFAGPNLHYANKKWWATLTVLPQLTGWPETKGHRDLEHFEKLQVRLKVGFNF
ncbi:MAG: hypothetical protein H7343_20115 [Undibacterium sp.]|nr:hypothetical protein [Opitutaceae bacterium]